MGKTCTFESNLLQEDKTRYHNSVTQWAIIKPFNGDDNRIIHKVSTLSLRDILEDSTLYATDECGPGDIQPDTHSST